MTIDVTEMTIADMLEALEERQVTSVDLVCAHLNRIAYFDRAGVCLNAVPILNPAALEEAEASDARRRAGAAPRPLEGIPFTVKDSYKVAGLTVASGSPAFENLIANEDAATVELLRSAGAVLLGKTNMPPMAAGGVQPGVYGYARSPYNPGYLTAAYGSGSSNGSAAATAASLCAFAMAEETLSSGRSPASNSGLVAYTPSRGLISIRGNWPLFPTCDVVVPYTRTMDDMLRLLDVLVVDDERTDGDFWRSQDAVSLPTVASVRPDRFHRERRTSLQGLRLGVPRMFLGDDPHKTNPVTIRPSVAELWEQAEADLRLLGAEVIPVDFPVVSNYELDRPGARGLVERGLVHRGWGATEIGPMIAAAWDEFLRINNMPGLSSLAEADGDQIFPEPPENVYANAGVAFDYARLVELAKAGLNAPETLEGFADSLQGLERARVEDFEEWLTVNGLDAVVFPSNGDVASAQLFNRPEHMDEALRNGVLFSNGNRAIRHLGIPTLTVPMGRMSDIFMPVGMTIAGPAYSDDLLLDIGSAFEASTQRRAAPPMTQSLPSSSVSPCADEQPHDVDLQLNVTHQVERTSAGWIVTAHLKLKDGAEGVALDDVKVEAWLDGRSMLVTTTDGDTWIATGRVSAALPRVRRVSMLVAKASGPGLLKAASLTVELPE